MRETQRVNARSLLAVVMLAVCSIGCTAAPEPEVVSPPKPEPKADPRPAPFDVPQTAGDSNGGAYMVRYRTVPDPIPNNEPFSIEVMVYDAGDTAETATDVSLVADAAMPQHRHGMIRKPSVENHGGGAFTVTGMLFHMSGAWELYFDITRGAVTERAQFDIDLE